MYTGLRLNYRLRLWAPTSASRAISLPAEIFVVVWQTKLTVKKSKKDAIILVGLVCQRQNERESYYMLGLLYGSVHTR